MSAIESPPDEWNPRWAMSLSAPLAATVHVQTSMVPAGGMISFVAAGFGTAGSIHVFVDHDHSTPVAVIAAESDPVSGRVPLPSSTRIGPHCLTFVGAKAEFDLLVDVVASQSNVTLSPRTSRPGESVHFEVRGFPPNSLAHVKLDDVGTAVPFRVDAEGVGSGTFELPTDLTAGSHHLRFLAANPPTSALERFVSTPAPTD